MTNLKKLSKNIVLAIDWAVAEYNYLEELKRELKTIEGEIEIKKELKELKKAAKILHYVARAERRAYLFEEKADRALIELLPELEKEGISADLILGLRDLATEIGIQHDQLVKLASFYDRTLEKELDKARVEVQLEKKLQEEHPQQAAQMHQAFLEILHHFSQQVEEAEKWIVGLERTLVNAKGLLKRIVVEGNQSFLKEGFSILRAYKFPVEKYPSEVMVMAQHHNDLKKLTNIIGDGWLFREGLVALAEAGIINERTWPIVTRGIKDLARGRGSNKSAVFEYGFPELAEVGVLNERTWLGLVEISTGVGENGKVIFEVCLPALVKAGIVNERTWPMIVTGLIDMAKATAKNSWNLFYHVLPSLAQWGTINEKTLPIIVAYVRIVGTDERALVSISRYIFLKKLIDSEIVLSAQDIEKMYKTLTDRRIKIERYEDVLTFLIILCAFPDNIERPLKHLIVELQKNDFKGAGRNLAEVISRIKERVEFLINLPSAPLTTKYLIHRLADLLPLGGNAKLIDVMRGHAVQLSVGQLGYFHSKLHQRPGREDVALVQAYVNFLEEGDITPLKQWCDVYDPNYNPPPFDWNRLQKTRQELRDRTLQRANDLLETLQELWHTAEQNPSVKSAELEQQFKALEMISEAKLMFQAVLKNLDKAGKYVTRGQKNEALQMLGPLRFDVRTLEGYATGDLKVEMYFLDVYLGSLEQQLHPDVLNTLKLDSWIDVKNVVRLAKAKTMSLLAMYQGDAAIAKAVNLLEEFEQTKDVNILQESLEYFGVGMNIINERVINEFREVLRQRVTVDKKDLENLLAPFYRTGSIFQLDQLLEILRQSVVIDKKTGMSKIQQVIKETPRPTSQHLRERLYQRAGL